MTTVHSTTAQISAIPGKLKYEFRIEQLPLRDDGDTVGSISASSYVLEGATAERPVLFLTNGGPGSASAFLHLSGIGPKRAAIPEDASRGVAPPYGTEDSPSTLLDTADLVFIDAPQTGFGEITGEAGSKPFYGMEADARVFAEAIAEWVTIHSRWDSPKYFLGESYGTHRAAMLASAVHEYEGLPLDGIVLLGQAVNIQEVAERPGNVIGALANLPYKAAVAWYHGVGSTGCTSSTEAVERALEYSWTELAQAMLQGTALDTSELRRVAERMSSMIGIPADELVRSRLWISKGEFRSRLLRDRGLSIGSNDGRYLAPATDAAFGESPIDATSTHLMPRYLAGLQQWLQEAFGEGVAGRYKMFDAEASKHWDWSDSGTQRFRYMGQPSPFDTYPYAAKLSRWMKQAPEARLFIGTGVYDSLTTVGAADHLVRQWDLPRERVTSAWYEGGHMMYSVPEVAAKLNDDLRAFIRRER